MTAAIGSRVWQYEYHLIAGIGDIGTHSWLAYDAHSIVSKTSILKCFVLGLFLV